MTKARFKDAIQEDLASAKVVFPKLNASQQRMWTREMLDAETRVKTALAKLAPGERGLLEYVLHQHLCSVFESIEQALSTGDCDR
jgi:hypothetical protein